MASRGPGCSRRDPRARRRPRAREAGRKPLRSCGGRSPRSPSSFRRQLVAPAATGPFARLPASTDTRSQEMTNGADLGSSARDDARARVYGGALTRDRDARRQGHPRST